jgi:hypothetical protein
VLPATARLREDLLDEGALMVWVPDRQVTPEAAAHLRDQIAETARSTPPAERPRTIDELIFRALQRWQAKAPRDAELHTFEQSATWVLVTPSRASGTRDA